MVGPGKKAAAGRPRHLKQWDKLFVFQECLSQGQDA